MEIDRAILSTKRPSARRIDIPSKKSAMCVEFTATATSKKNVSAANVFGFVDDYDGNSAATNNDTGTSRVVLSQIDRPIPEGTSEVKFVVTVFKDSYKKGAFKLRGFKAIEANAAINKRFVPLGDCDLDPAAPGCPNDPNAYRMCASWYLGLPFFRRYVYYYYYYY